MKRHVNSFATLALVACAVFTFAACSRNSDSATAPLPSGAISGNWSGALTDSILGSGTLTMTLSQFGDSVNGTWTSTFPDSINDLIGTVRGAIGGSTLTILLKPLGGSTCQFGPYLLTATVTSTGSMSGKLTEAYPCDIGDGGSFSGAKN
jgi:hypothetical protein